MAELARLNRVTIAKYESGKVEPGAQALTRIADALEVTVDELLGRKPEEQTDSKYIEAKTIEARIISGGIDKMPPEERERALDMMKIVFHEYADYFERNENDDNDR